MCLQAEATFVHQGDHDLMEMTIPNVTAHFFMQSRGQYQWYFEHCLSLRIKWL